MTITVCVPVWNGASFVAETLACLRQQTLTDLRVLISVDDSEDDSAAVCQAFALDPRFEVTVQPARLGWIDNVNWLLRRVETPFGCILPHDDLVAPDYLARLVAQLKRHPSAVLAYGDIETFGIAEVRIAQPELTGDRLDRIVTFLRYHAPAVGFRGVFRRSVLDRGHYLRPDVDGYAADTLWMLALAGEGDLLRVPEVLYRKRMHDASVTAEWRSLSRLVRRIKWVAHCLACCKVAMAAADWSISERLTIVAAVVARLPGPLHLRAQASRQTQRAQFRRRKH